MTKAEQIVEKVVVTFVEAGAAYLIVMPTVNWTKTTIAGAIGAGLSAVYNGLRQSNPTILPPTNISAAVPTPSADLGVMNGVPQLTAPSVASPVVPSAPASEDTILDDLANDTETTPPVTDPPA